MTDFVQELIKVIIHIGTTCVIMKIII